MRQITEWATTVRHRLPARRQCAIPGWPGLEGDSPKPRGFLRSAQSSPGHPFVLIMMLFLASGLCHAVQADFQATADILKSRQQTIVKLFGAGGGNLDSYGTGTLVSAEGHVATVWNHLVGTGYLTAITADGRKFSVDVVGTSAEHDLALLKLRTEPGDSFACIDLSKAIDSDPGTPVLAFSNMFHVATGNEPVSVVHGVIAASIPLEATQGRWKFPLKSPVWLVDAITNNSGAAGGLLTDTKGTPIGLIGREIRHAASRTWVNYADREGRQSSGYQPT